MNENESVLLSVFVNKYFQVKNIFSHNNAHTHTHTFSETHF